MASVGFVWMVLFGSFLLVVSVLKVNFGRFGLVGLVGLVCYGYFGIVL